MTLMEAGLRSISLAQTAHQLLYGSAGGAKAIRAHLYGNSCATALTEKEPKGNPHNPTASQSELNTAVATWANVRGCARIERRKLIIAGRVFLLVPIDRQAGWRPHLPLYAATWGDR